MLLGEAIDCSAPIDTVYFETDADRALRQRVATAGIQSVEVAPGALAKVLDLAHPQSFVSVLRKREVPSAEIVASCAQRRRPVLALVGIQDPGNAGTLIRVAEATGCAGVLFTEGSVDAWNPKTVRASAGSVLRVPICTAVPLGLMAGHPKLARANDPELVATVASGGVAPEDADLSGAKVILIGSEAHGLPRELRTVAAITVSVPMEGSVESLNAAVAGSLLAFEAARQRRHPLR